MTITKPQLTQIISLAKQGTSSTQIALQVGCGDSTCRRVIRKHLPHLNRSKGGRPARLDTATKRRLARDIVSGRAQNATQLAKTFNTTAPIPVSPQTIRNALKEADLKAFTKAQRPKLTSTQRKNRLLWARKYEHWTVDDWKRVLWSDEVKINFINSDGRVWAWQKKGEDRYSEKLVTGTVKHGGGKINIWGCMGWNGVGYCVEVEGNLDKVQYVDILESSVVKSFNKLGLRQGQKYFQQDNDPKHTSDLAMKWFQRKKLDVLDWPSQSPDLNPIEHLWVLLKVRLSQYGVPPKGTHELWERVEEVWNDIAVDECRRLIESMPRRIKAVIKAKGGNTKY